MSPDQLKQIDEMVADMLAGYSSIQAFAFYLEKLKSDSTIEFYQYAPIHIKLYNRAAHIAAIEITKRYREGTLKRVPKDNHFQNLKKH